MPEIRNDQLVEPETVDVLPDGTHIIYAREDSGINLPHQGLVLRPGEPLEVGEGKDVSGALAARFVKAGVCRIFDPETESVEEVVEETAAPADAAPAIQTAAPGAPIASASTTAAAAPSTPAGASAAVGTPAAPARPQPLSDPTKSNPSAGAS